MNWTPTTPISPHSGLPARFPPTKDSTRCTILVQCKFFRMNTCKSVSKQRTLSPFGMNTYEKSRGEGGASLQPRTEDQNDARIRRPRQPSPRRELATRRGRPAVNGPRNICRGRRDKFPRRYLGRGTFAVWDHSGNLYSYRFAAIARRFFTDPFSKERFMKAFFIGKRALWDSIGPHVA
jgi:hypothetical protein